MQGRRKTLKRTLNRQKNLYRRKHRTPATATATATMTTIRAYPWISSLHEPRYIRLKITT
ncbi:hypothetical protein AWRI1631_80940 [Saccharomyces cerevisiae AWRI1631]|uniref:Uncharacterized protein n=1 Tax=Saccharomyces cerevisiae (strain AWRI1631) TaxID=545124 RepID=B5VJX3_YEAS6|nr:hypothetical protein AWRI1631_80940 [Saccharomyces cerevisiae AWRI1631]